VDIHEIKKLLPHREPFLFIDEVLERSATRTVARRVIRKDEVFFQGHFPEEPIFPGVLIVEALAQTGGVMLMHRYKNSLPLFMGIDKARFRRIVKPGDTLLLEVEIVHDRGRIVRLQGVAKVGDEIACEAMILAGVQAQ
jgi:3-hydroxyacyl-[acyl-carrier-protein] dehydratase